MNAFDNPFHQTFSHERVPLQQTIEKERAIEMPTPQACALIQYNFKHRLLRPRFAAPKPALCGLAATFRPALRATHRLTTDTYALALIIQQAAS